MEANFNRPGLCILSALISMAQKQLRAKICFSAFELSSLDWFCICNI